MKKPILVHLILFSLFVKQFRLGVSTVSWSKLFHLSITRFEREQHWPSSRCGMSLRRGVAVLNVQYILNSRSIFISYLRHLAWVNQLRMREVGLVACRRPVWTPRDVEAWSKHDSRRPVGRAGGGLVVHRCLTVYWSPATATPGQTLVKLDWVGWGTALEPRGNSLQCSLSSIVSTTRPSVVARSLRQLLVSPSSTDSVCCAIQTSSVSGHPGTFFWPAEYDSLVLSGENRRRWTGMACERYLLPGRCLIL